MRTFKWSPTFHVDRESSVVPIWINLHKLPIQFFNRDALFAIVKPIGQPLRLDSATTSFKRPSVARIQVEIDLMKPLPSRIWIAMEESIGFWQKVEPDEVLPSYCSYYWHVGHTEALCHIKNLELKAIGKQQQKPATQQLQYHPKPIAGSLSTESTGPSIPSLESLPPTAEETLPPEKGKNLAPVVTAAEIPVTQTHNVVPPPEIFPPTAGKTIPAVNPSSSGLTVAEKAAIPIESDGAVTTKKPSPGLVSDCIQPNVDEPISVQPVLALISDVHPVEPEAVPQVEVPIPSNLTSIDEAPSVLESPNVAQQTEIPAQQTIIQVTINKDADPAPETISITNVAKEVDSELLMMKEKGFSTQTVVIHHEN